LIITGTNLLYEIGKEILENNNEGYDIDGGLMILATNGTEA
tara:strand:- start:445 stop:567 length:123 start_codon:yes stop_codon:yes gene_type:complete